MEKPTAGRPEYFAQLMPDETCLIEGQCRLTWKQWNDQADCVAAGFAARGIGPRDRVAVRSRSRIEWFIVNLALAKLGALHVALNWHLTPKELSYIIGDSGATALVFDDEGVAEMTAAMVPLGLRFMVSICPSSIEDVADLAALLSTPGAPSYFSTADAPLIIYTSGTTGRPKGAAPDFERLKTPSEELIAYQKDIRSSGTANFDPAEKPRGLLTMPLHHAAGPHSARGCLALGGVVSIMRRFDPEGALALIEAERIDRWSAVPTMLHRIESLGSDVLKKYDVSSLRQVNVGAAPVSFALKEWAINFFGDKVLYEAYGMTETGMIAGIKPVDQKRKPGSCGKPYKGVSIKIYADDQEQSPGETGEILVKTPVLISGYLNKGPLGSDKITDDGFFRTGDMGFLDDEGFLYVTDRIVDMIISGGVNIYPAEIEFALAKHPSIVEAAVIGIPNDDFGEQVAAFCELRPGAELTQDELTEFCREELAGYKVPRYVEFTSELPRNPMGKLLKNKIREAHWKDRGRKL